tara:strand:+ start:165 stop:914 length:750 start_codon:yes stop_codon:yes gene_type:complete
MIKNFLIFLTLISCAFCMDFLNLFDEANDFYIKEDYEKSIELYELIIGSGLENSAVFYNLGNSYYRSKDIGQAIWAYKNANKLNPRDKDIAHNLKIAEANKIDRINSPQLFIIHNFYKKIKSAITIFELVLVGAVLLFILSFSWVTKSVAEKKNQVLKNIAQILLVSTIVVHLFILEIIFENKKTHNKAVIIKKFKAQSGPFLGDNKVLFNINEGSVVEVLQEKNNWSQIILIDGKKGWILSNALRKMK